MSKTPRTTKQRGPVRAAKADGIAGELRRAVANAEKRGQSRYAIAKSAGVSYSVMTRIAIGENLPRLDTAEKIAEAIGNRLHLIS